MTAGARRRAAARDVNQGYRFVLPAVVTLFVVLVFPLASTFYWSVVTETRTGVTFAEREQAAALIADNGPAPDQGISHGG